MVKSNLMYYREDGKCCKTCEHYKETCEKSCGWFCWCKEYKPTFARDYLEDTVVSDFTIVLSQGEVPHEQVIELTRLVDDILTVIKTLPLIEVRYPLSSVFTSLQRALSIYNLGYQRGEEKKWEMSK